MYEKPENIPLAIIWGCALIALAIVFLVAILDKKCSAEERSITGYVGDQFTILSEDGQGNITGFVGDQFIQLRRERARDDHRLYWRSVHDSEWAGNESGWTGQAPRGKPLGAQLWSGVIALPNSRPIGRHIGHPVK